MKQVSGTEHKGVVEIPAILGIGIVRVQPPLAVIVPLDVEHVRVAVGVSTVPAPIQTTAS